MYIRKVIIFSISLVLLFSSSAFAIVHSKEYVTKNEVNEYYSEMREKLYSATYIISTSSDIDTHIMNLIRQNKRARELREIAETRQ